MPIEDYLLQAEKVLNWSDFHVTYGEDKYRVFVSNLRLILFREKGVLFKQEEVITETWGQIKGLQFAETGRLVKRGKVRFSSSKGEITLDGPKNGMLTLFKAIQNQTIKPEQLGQPVLNYPWEKEDAEEPLG